MSSERPRGNRGPGNRSSGGDRSGGGDSSRRGAGVSGSNRRPGEITVPAEALKIWEDRGLT